MSPRSAMSFSTTSSSLYTEDVPASIDVISLDDPAKMSPPAIRAELQYYGVEMSLTGVDRRDLEKALIFARRNSNSGGSSQDGNGNGKNGNGGSGGHGHHHQQQGGLGEHQQQQYQHKRELRPSPTQQPADHLQETAAKVPGMRVTPPHSQQYAQQPSSRNAYSSGSGNNPTHIPLTPSNKIPPQILNVIKMSADPSMKAINLDHRNLGDKEVIKLSEAIRSNRTVEFLSLRNCAVTDAGVEKLSDMLLRNSKLVELHLDGNRISTEGAAALSTALITNETLAVLTLNENEGIQDKGVVYLIGALEHNTTLRTLEVNDCGIFGGARNRLEQIEALLADRQIDSNFESLLERLLDDDFRVTGIDLSGRRIGDKGAARLAEALVDNTQVRQLWLRGCNLGDPGAKALASCLEQNMAIVDLFLGNNSIGNAGLVAISDALALSNLTLVSLELDDNRVGEGGIDSFIRALVKNTSVLVASFENNPIGNSGKTEMIQSKLVEKRNCLNLVSFVVDPDAGGSVADDNNMSGLINMSVCSSFMPSTYRRAGISSQAGQQYRNSLRDSGDRSNLKKSAGELARSSGSVQYSVYHRASSSPKPPAPPPKPPPPQPQERRSPPQSRQLPPMPPFAVRQQPAREMEPVASPPQTQRQQRSMQPVESINCGIVSPKSSVAKPASVRSASVRSGSAKSGSHKSPKNMVISAPKPPVQPTPPVQPKPARPRKKATSKKARAMSPPPTRSNVYQKAHVPVPLKALALETIAERSSVASRSTVSGSRGVASSHNQRSASMEQSKMGSTAHSQSRMGSTAYSQSRMGSQPELTRSTRSQLSPLEEEDEEEDFVEGDAELVAPLVIRKRSKASRSQASTAASTQAPTIVTEMSTQGCITEASQPESIANPDTQRNYNTTLKKLWRRVEMMKRTNHFAAAHYRARHFWFWFVPISSCLFLSIVLSLAIAVDIPGASRLGLSLSTAGFATCAFALNFLQTRFGWSSRAEVHRSAEVELGQVAFRLDTLGKYEGRGLSTGSHSTKCRANAIRDLFRIDVYLQAMQRCTPNVPDAINEVFYLLASRLKGICMKYPRAVKLRSAYALYDEEPNAENPVPVEMQIDALDLLGTEIENYFLYPLFMPNARDVVSRTIDIFFAKPQENEMRGDSRNGSRDYHGSGDETSMDSRSFYSYDDEETELV